MNEIISIIIPTFNRSKLLEETVKSIKKQSYKNWELILVDDGSDVRHYKFIEEIANSDSRIRLNKRNRNPKGACTCRNIGIEKAQGSFLMFFDSDDILFKDALLRRVITLSNNSSYDFCISKGIKGEFPLDEQKDYLLISSENNQDIIQDFFTLTPPFVPASVTYIARFIKENRILWDENLIGFQDIDYHIKVVLQANNFIYQQGLPDVLWRIHNSGNIGLTLVEGTKTIKAKLRILKNNLNEETILKTPNLLMIQVVRSYVFSKFTENITKEGFRFYCEKYNKGNLVIILYWFYRFLIKRNIRFLTRVLRFLLILLGEKYIFEGNTRISYFLQDSFDINVLNEQD